MVSVELNGKVRSRGIVAINSEWVESGEGGIAALKLIEGSFSQIQPMPVCILDVLIFLIEASV